MADKLAPVYLLWGSDGFSREQAQRALIDRVVDPAWRAFNLTLLPPDATLAEACSSVQTPPFGSGGRAVVVANSTLFGPSKGSAAEGEPEERKASEGNTAILENLLRHNWIAGNCLIFSAESVDRRRRLFKTIESLGEVREFNPVKPWEAERILLPWLEEEAGRSGARLTRAAGECLLQAVGTDRQRLYSELQKVITFAGSGVPIQPDHVTQIVSGEEADIFSWLELLARRDFEAALTRLRRLLLVEPVLKIIASLGTNLVRLYRMKLLHETGQSPGAIASAVGTSPGLVGKTLKLWQGYTTVQIFRHLESLLDLEVALKTRGGGRADQVAHLEVWLAKWRAGGRPANNRIQG